MEIMTKRKFEEAKNLKPIINENSVVELLDDVQMEKLLKEMQNPLNFQKELAVKVKISLDHRMKMDLERDGILGEITRKWVESYAKILEKIQSAIYGDKSVNLHIHKISHGDIAARLRELK